MKKDLSQGSVAVYTERRRNKSIWLRSCVIFALVVVMLTGYALIFPAQTVEKELICGQTEHIHDDNCRLTALTCGLEEGEEHTHTAACYTTVLTCGMEEHVHTDDCYAEPEPLTEPVVTQEPVETESAAETAEPVTEPVVSEPEESEGPTDPAETTEPEEPVVTEPADPAPTEPEEPIDVITRPGRQEEEYSFPEEGIDLAPYLESVIFQRQEGGALVEETWFENGQTAKASIIYDIPKDTVTPDSRYVYYQLPEGIAPIERTSGEVMDDGVSVGVYTITEEGLIQILFNEEFANGNAIMGTVEFNCYLYANEDGSDRIIEFENEAGTITVTVPDEQRYDLRIEKTGEFNADYTRAEYLLTVRSDKGTGLTVTVRDWLTNQTPETLFSADYDRSCLEVRLVAADGSVTALSEYTVVWDEDGGSFTVSELPPLEEGARYELVYAVELEPDLSGSFELDNEAVASAGDLEATTGFFITYTCDVTKSGAFNPVTGLIDWVITVNPESRPVAGWRIEDTLPYPAVGKVLLTNANGVRYADLTPADGRSISYTFPPNAPARPYFLRYSTVAPTTAQTVRNTVRLVNERETVVVSEVEVEERSEGVDKILGSKHVYPNGLVRTNWSFVVTMPVGELDSYTFRDNISTPVMDVNNGEYLDSYLHFGYAAELEAALRGNLRLISDGVSWYYGDEANDYVEFRLSYYDAQGNLLSPEDSETRVSRVVFELLPLQGSSFHGYQVAADNYPTWLDASGAQEGDYWSYQNFLYLRSGNYDVALAFYRKGNAFEKQVKLNGKFDSEDGYVDYAACRGELEYRLLVDLSAMVDESLTITDLLPEGLELLPDSVRAFYTGANLHGEYAGTFSQEENFSFTAAPGAEGDTLLTFTAQGVNELMKQTYAYLCVVYKVRLTDEGLWNDYTHSIESFTNTAVWEDYTAQQTTTVENQPKRLEKDGKQLLDEEGNPVSRIRYTLLINAGAEDLDSAGDWITLTDQFSAGIGANLELSSVRLYHYDPSRPGGVGNRVMPYEFHLAYNTAAKTMTLELKDETAYVLVYDYNVDYTAILDGQTVVANNAKLVGKFESSTEIALRGVSSSATAWQRVITITKVDADNYAKVLPGAKFLLEYWDPELGVWMQKIRSYDPELLYETDENGQIVLTFLGSEADLVTGRLYRLTEVEAPLGYDMADTVIWFLCMPKTNQSNVQVFLQAGAGSDVDIDKVLFFANSGGTCVVPNPFCGLTVNKRWFLYDGTEMTDPEQDPITVTLYRSTDPTGESGMVQVPATDTLENPVRFGAEEAWTYTWGGLSAYDEHGNALYYFVAEDPVPGFTPTYINNGITGGTIVISNDCEPYELPETGSHGSRQFVGLGGLLMLLAVVAYIKFKKSEEKQ